MAKRKGKKSDQTVETPEVVAAATEPEDGAPENGTQEEAPEEEQAQLEVKAKGPAAAVRRDLRRFSRTDEEQEQEDAEEGASEEEAQPESADPEGDRLSQLLSNPKNKLIITRLYPRRYRGHRCDTRVDEYQCPQDIQDLTQDIFTRFGGKRFKISIHPNTPTGDAKILGVFMVENPDMDEPIFESAGDTVATFGPEEDDRFSQPEEPDPAAVAEKVLKDRVKRAAKKIELKELERTARQLEEDEGDGGSARGRERNEAAESHSRRADIDDLRRQIAEAQKQNEIAALKSEFDRRLEIVEKTANPHKGMDANTTVLVELMKSSQAQFTALMTALSQSQAQMIQAISATNKGSSSEDSILDRMLKYKNLLAPKEDENVKRFHETAYSLLMEQLENKGNGGAGSGEPEEDTIRFAIRELAPTLKLYVEKQLEAKQAALGSVASDEQRRIAYHEAAQQAARELSQKWQREGYVVRGPNSAREVPRGLPPVQPQISGVAPVGTPAPGPQEAGPGGAALPPGLPPPHAVEPEDQEEIMGKHADLPGIGKVLVPPSPESDVYNRNAAVNFVLDSIRSEIKQRIPQTDPNKSYIVGDALDRLDDDTLGQISKVSSGAELERVLSPWADPAKIAEIKEAGNDPVVKTFISRVVTTIGSEFQRQMTQPMKQ
jgi:hypothetical protein